MLEKAQVCYKTQVNARRLKAEYKVGQMMLLTMKNFTMLQGLTPKFIFKFVGLFFVVECVVNPKMLDL
jgi:hypothetical protein